MDRWADFETTTHRIKEREVLHSMLPHEAYLSDVLLALEQGAMSNRMSIRFVDRLSLEKKDLHPINPDALMLLHHPQLGNIWGFVEYDNSTERSGDIVGKMERYMAHNDSKLGSKPFFKTVRKYMERYALTLGEPESKQGFRVLWVSKTPEGRDSLFRYAVYYYPDMKGMFLFTSLADIRANGFFGSIWYRVMDFKRSLLPKFKDDTYPHIIQKEILKVIPQTKRVSLLDR